MTINDELGSKWKNMVMTYFKLLSHNFLEGQEDRENISELRNWEVDLKQGLALINGPHRIVQFPATWRRSLRNVACMNKGILR